VIIVLVLNLNYVITLLTLLMIVLSWKLFI